MEDGAIRDDRGWFHIVTCKGDVSYYVFTSDGSDEALYRKAKNSDFELVAELPKETIDWNFVPNGNYLYFQAAEQDTNGWYHDFYRIDTKKGSVESISTIGNGYPGNLPFALSGKTLYYTYRNIWDQKRLCGLDLKPLEESHYDIPDKLLREGTELEFYFSAVYSGPDNSCIFAPYWDNHGEFYDYVNFRPDEYTCWAQDSLKS